MNGFLDKLIYEAMLRREQRLSADTPANPAIPAKSEDGSGPKADLPTCEDLRILRIQPNDPPEIAEIADVRKSENEPQSEHSCGSSQDSQDSQGSPQTNAFAPRSEPGVGGEELLCWIGSLEPLVGTVDVANLTLAAGPGWSRGPVWGEVKHMVELGFVRRNGHFLELTLAARRWAYQHRRVGATDA